MGLINENINIENCFIKKREYNEKYNFTKSNNCKAKIIGMKTDEDIKQCQSDITTMDNINIIKLFTYKTEDNNWLIELIFDSQKNCNKFIGKWILNNKKNPACKKFKIYNNNVSKNKIKYKKIADYASKLIENYIYKIIRDCDSIETDDKIQLMENLNLLIPKNCDISNIEIEPEAFDFLNIYTLIIEKKVKIYIHK